MAMLNNQMANVFFPAIHVTDYQRVPEGTFAKPQRTPKPDGEHL